jgi:hypothetical protein
LEKAVADINKKYTTPLNTCLGDDIQDTGADRLMHAKCLSFYARSGFRPRYQLPRFVDTPAKTDQPTAGELQQLSSEGSTLSDMLDTKGVECGNEGGCHFPTLLLDEVLGPIFNLEEFMAEQQRTGPDILKKTGDNCSADSWNAPSSKSTTRTVVCWETDEKNPAEVIPRPDVDQIEAERSSTEQLTSSVMMKDSANNDSATAKPDMQYPYHRRMRSNSERPSRDPSMSSFGNPDHDSVIPAISCSDVRRLRPRSTPDRSETYSDVMMDSRRISGSSRVSISHDDNVPSVSELVSKFRRMASPPGAFPTTLPPATLAPFTKFRQVSRGKQFEAFLGRFSNDSGSNSAQVSGCGDRAERFQSDAPEVEVGGQERNWLDAMTRRIAQDGNNSNMTT